LEPLLEDCKEGETIAEKYKWKRKLSTTKEELKTALKLAGAEALKAYKLFHCFIIGEAQTQWDKFVQEIHTKDPWVGLNGQSHKGVPKKARPAKFCQRCKNKVAPI
jgi:hypothetical protein